MKRGGGRTINSREIKTCKRKRGTNGWKRRKTRKRKGAVEVG